MQKGLVLILALVGIAVFVACAAGMTETEVREIARDEMVLVPAPTGIPGPPRPTGGERSTWSNRANRHNWYSRSDGCSGTAG